MVNCFECGNVISSNAESCPHCGNPMVGPGRPVLLPPMARPGSVLLPPPPVHAVHVKRQRPSGYKWVTVLVCVLCVVPVWAVYTMTRDVADTEPVSQASRSTKSKPVSQERRSRRSKPATQTELPRYVRALRTGNGHDYLALSTDEKRQLCDLIARTLKVKTSWYYFNFFSTFYLDEANNFVNNSIPIKESAALATAWPDE